MYRFSSSVPTGGTPGFTVNWSTGTSVAIGAGRYCVSTSLCATVSPITATVTDANGCPAIYSSPVLQPAAALTAITSQTNATCGNTCNAVASVTVSGVPQAPALLIIILGLLRVLLVEVHQCNSTLCGSNTPFP